MENILYFSVRQNLLKKKNELFEAIKEEEKKIGYYHLPFSNTQKIKAQLQHLNSEIQDIVVIGIGGSSLGAKAVYNFLKPQKSFAKRLFFLESTDPLHIQNIQNQIDLKKTHFFIISKSGTTLETIALFK